MKLLTVPHLKFGKVFLMANVLNQKNALLAGESRVSTTSFGEHNTPKLGMPRELERWDGSGKVALSSICQDRTMNVKH
ncbi:hypothetical protein [Massilia sp.]|uniref:hypothetical protein n=1 Tax=Massilia sp. TaxID=1882437 RepID=UPI00352D8895